ncbi:oxidoreductase [Streptomyces sp. ERV7]|uniref:oxidoreductase n=1 Tax=Streptomyces sp. ERV7 TaxID=1322334 RepID=UPI0007F459BB|nr:oxidoreductase [Streptomyces sp. ERV7]OAR23120.1 oxidoreductase [Streptomyces sp. ERV7]
MSAAYATFSLAPAMRAGDVAGAGSPQLHRDFMDFVVDGRPLLLQLADLDAVSPLAADVPPAILGAQVRSLLLETAPPLADGRYVVYACPECEDLACGAVTAVIERCGDDIIWRDFAWQTEPVPDLMLNGYHGIGPFRFRAEEYRAALERLLCDEPPRRRVLLVGARAAVLGKLAAALRSIGIGADIAHDVTDAIPEELLAYGAVAFGRAVPEAERAAVRAAFARARAHPVYVTGLAPVTPLLVAQLEQALDRTPPAQRRLTYLSASPDEARLAVGATCRVRLTAYRLDRLHRVRTQQVLDAVLDPGPHRIPLDERALRGESFLVARTTGGVITAAVVR